MIGAVAAAIRASFAARLNDLLLVTAASRETGADSVSPARSA